VSAATPEYAQTKKNPATGPGWEALLLSHTKAPAQGGKAGSHLSAASWNVTPTKSDIQLLPVNPDIEINLKIV
jgi:hypothetical protein